MDCSNLGSFASLLPLSNSTAPRRLSYLSTKQRSNHTSLLKKKNLVVRSKSSGFEENSSTNGFPEPPNKIITEEAIGAEYGEGFETFRPDGPLKIDVHYLNENLQEGFLKRVRYAMKPDEAFGLIFSWENVVADTRALKLNTWRQLAAEEGKDLPDDESLQTSILYADVDNLLQKVLFWDKDEQELERLKARLSHLYYENLLKFTTPMDGLKEWLDAVSKAQIPCAIVSFLDRRKLVEVLHGMGLSKYFQAVVTEEDGMESIAHKFLSAAVKLDRKPSRCVVFEDDPRGIAAAHNCTMMAVGLIGALPAYELVQADIAVARFSDLSVINLRRLFAPKGTKFMDAQKQIIEESPPKRKLRIDTIF